jgi:hypothetical protein
MNTTLPKPQEILDKFLMRDRTAVEEVNNYGPGGIEARLNFTSARCQDTASMVVYILKYLIEQETQMVYILKYLVEQETQNEHTRLNQPSHT